MRVLSHPALNRRIHLLVLTAGILGLAVAGLALFEAVHLALSHSADAQRAGGSFTAALLPEVVISLLLVALLAKQAQRLMANPIHQLAQTVEGLSSKWLPDLDKSPRESDELERVERAIRRMTGQLEVTAERLQVSERSCDRLGGENQLLRDELEKRRAELTGVYRQVGQAEVASGVLHNVGNVISHVNVATTLLHSRLRHSRIEHLGKTLQLLRENRENLPRFLSEDPKGKVLPGYLEHLSDRLIAEQADILAEVGLLARDIEHIKEIVATQQSYARSSGRTETLDLPCLLQDAIRLHLGSFESHGITLVRDFASVPSITADKHRVLQILVNLLRNARHAMDDLGPPEKRLILSIGSRQPGSVIISVRDNGIGIAPEHLARIFDLGFTTKQHGLGLGLHLSAVAARELGGELTVFSEGIGTGATFRIELPIAPPRPTNASSP